MQDSLTGQVDSFYIVSFDSTINTFENNTNEALDIKINEVSTSNYFLVTKWYINTGLVGNYALDLGYQIANHPDSIVEFGNFLYTFDTGTPVAVPEVDFINNGKTYSHSYQNTWYYLTKPPFTTVVLSKDSGWVYISSDFGSYKHVWQLVRSKIIR